MEIADEIWLDGLEKARQKFDPQRGAQFKTFLYSILQREAGAVRRHFLSHLPPKVWFCIVTIRHEGIFYGSPGYQIAENGQIVPWYTRFTFDFQGCDHSFLPCGFKLPSRQMKTLDDNDEEYREPQATVSEWEQEREYREFYDHVGHITEAEFRRHGRDHLPKSYRKWTDKRLKKELAELDVRIVQMLIDDKPARQIEIQRTLGITKYFYNARIDVILRRLELPCAPLIRYPMIPNRQAKPVTRIVTDKVLVFSPPSILTCRTADGKFRVEKGKRGALSFVGNEDIFRWHDDIAETPINELTLPYIVHDSEHWELIEEFIEEE